MRKPAPTKIDLRRVSKDGRGLCKMLNKLYARLYHMPDNLYIPRDNDVRMYSKRGRPSIWAVLGASDPEEIIENLLLTGVTLGIHTVEDVNATSIMMREDILRLFVDIVCADRGYNPHRLMLGYVKAYPGVNHRDRVLSLIKEYICDILSDHCYPEYAEEMSKRFWKQT